ncbi:MFS transporter [Rhodospirillaceae bacterium KN72]|uniref:MFS transporter n=1 Tax=Pacificispira spongiicola TaxID=2729598 RepID=A0A7Y0DWE4_9PROT|nr:MFS transporter [Pacificispira spongiicola]NMM42850.1 MFS transporter [Pacificispira spongiicola]
MTSSPLSGGSSGTGQPPAFIQRTGLFAMAAVCGLAVANIYYNQPMIGIIEAEFEQPEITRLIPTATQLGYALGLFFLLPVGDIVERRRLIVGQFLLLAVALVGAALATSAWVLVAASLAVGASASVAQQIVPLSATLSDPARRGRAIGTVMAGLLSGILLSRTLSGFVGEHLGWRDMFWVGVPLALVSAGLMRRVLPVLSPHTPMAYGRALRSLANLWMRHRELRAAALVQACLFGSFSAFWTILALYLAGPNFGLGADVAGLFGVLGVVGVAAAPIAGKLSDKYNPRVTVWAGVALCIFAWGAAGSFAAIAALIIAVIVMDFGFQIALISNQHIVYSLAQAARGRLNTILMTGMFLGGAAGSALSTYAWAVGGWGGVSILGVGLAVAALAVMAVHRPKAA